MALLWASGPEPQIASSVDDLLAHLAIVALEIVVAGGGGALAILQIVTNARHGRVAAGTGRLWLVTTMSLVSFALAVVATLLGGDNRSLLLTVVALLGVAVGTPTLLVWSWWTAAFRKKMSHAELWLGLLWFAVVAFVWPLWAVGIHGLLVL